MKLKNIILAGILVAGPLSGTSSIAADADTVIETSYVTLSTKSAMNAFYGNDAKRFYEAIDAIPVRHGATGGDSASKRNLL